MSETWRVWRHKENAEIRYYVEMVPIVADLFEPKEYAGPPDPEEPGTYLYGLVRLKSTRNVAFDDSDYALHLAPEAGLWPREAFEALYRPEKESVA